MNKDNAENHITNRETDLPKIADCAGDLGKYEDPNQHSDFSGEAIKMIKSLLIKFSLFSFGLTIDSVRQAV